MSREYEISNEEIEEVKKEIQSITDAGGIIILKARKRREEYLNSVHESHTMTEWTSKIMAPAGTPRFYTYRECTKCGGEQYHHVAGQFIDPELKRKCVS